MDLYINPTTLRFDNRYKTLKERRTEQNRKVKHFAIDGISSDNEYVPIFAPKVNKGIYNGKVVHYSIPKINGMHNRGHSGYMSMYRDLATQTLPFRFQTKSMESPILGLKGILFEPLHDSRVNILFLVAVKTEYMKKMFSEMDRDHVPNDLSKFAIFMSREFYTHPKYKTLQRKIHKELIEPLLVKGIEVIITNNIEERCFRNNIVKPRFRTVTALKEYLTSFNSEL